MSGPRRSLVCLSFVLLGLLCRPATPLQAEQPEQPTQCPGYYLSPQERIGINVARDEGKTITDYPIEQLGIGWYLDYRWQAAPARPATSAPPGQMHYMPMVRAWQLPKIQDPVALQHALSRQLAPALQNHPGATWLLGNEPDNRMQDNQHPEAYAAFYHTTYHLIKALDPSAQVAMAPVTQVTPLRLRYLDQILAAYRARYGEPLPVDVWTVHVYILPEVAGVGRAGEEAAWGIGVPPGLEAYADEAVHVTLDQHDDLQRFGAQIGDFRAWLAARGYREKPLYLTEFGILLSPDHGFDTARVQTFLLQSFAYLQQARDMQHGFPDDDNRLVQRWAWFSLNYYAFDPTAPATDPPGLNGNLFDHRSGAMTPLGATFVTYMNGLHGRMVDLAIRQETTGAAGHAPRRITIVNRGDATAPNFRLRLWWGNNVLGGPSNSPYCPTVAIK